MDYKFVSFDVADGTFNFFTQSEWENFIADIREWIAWEEHTEWETADVSELLEAMYGEEFFWEEIA